MHVEAPCLAGLKLVMIASSSTGLKIKNPPFQVGLFSWGRTRLPVANLVFTPSSPVPFADGDLPVAFSSPLVGALSTSSPTNLK